MRFLLGKIGDEPRSSFNVTREVDDYDTLKKYSRRMCAVVVLFVTLQKKVTLLSDLL